MFLPKGGFILTANPRLGHLSNTSEDRTIANPKPISETAVRSHASSCARELAPSKPRRNGYSPWADLEPRIVFQEVCNGVCSTATVLRPAHGARREMLHAPPTPAPFPCARLRRIATSSR